MSARSQMKTLWNRPVDALRELVTAESWDYADAETQYLTHGVHRYSGKFIPQIASRAIQILSEPGELVLDPYAGSGTTLVEAALLGRRGIGIDLNPLAVLISRCKTTAIPRAALDEMQSQLRSTLGHLLDTASMPLFDEDEASAPSAYRADERLDDPWFSKWFSAPVLEQLVQIDHAIRSLKDPACQDAARVAFSDVLRKSSNAHSGYPNVMFDRNAPERRQPIGPFFRKLAKVCAMVDSLSSTDARWEDVNVQLGTATDLPLPSESVDAVVTHPPYIGSVPYAEYGALSLMWLGADPKALDSELTGGRRQRSDVVSRFRLGYHGMLAECSRVLRPGRLAFVLVGNPTVRREVIDLGQMTEELASETGLEVGARAERVGVNRRANKMGSEHLLFLRKPT